MVRSLNIVVAAVAVALVGSVHFAAFGQTPPVQDVPAVSTPATRDASKVETFRSRLQDQQKTLESYGAKISGLVDRLKAMSGATVESRIAEVRSLRDALVQLGTQLQPDAPLSQSIDQYQSWISGQMGRVNNQRSTLGPEFVQELVRRYQQYQQEVTRARESVSNHSNAIDRALKELTMAELRAAEMLMAEDAATAVKELNGVLDSVGQTIDDIRSNLRKLGNAGV
jgi:chromosome segregation ATPase